MNKRIPRNPAPLTQQRLHELLRYDPLTGVFTNRTYRSSKAKPGDVAGTRHSAGYVQISLDKHLYFAHRLAWLYMKGEWPMPQCDHKDGVRSNNRWDNLRQASIPEQRQNRAVRHDSKSGVLGVYYSSRLRKYQARCRAGDTFEHSRWFKDLDSAAEAYREIKARLHTFNPTARDLPKVPAR